jgi:hypothetical protein
MCAHERACKVAVSASIGASRRAEHTRTLRCYPGCRREMRWRQRLARAVPHIALTSRSYDIIKVLAMLLVGVWLSGKLCAHAGAHAKATWCG